MMADLSRLSDEDLIHQYEDAWRQSEAFDREHHLLNYVPVSETARQFHLTEQADVIGLFGGNRAGKTGCALADIAICATGVIPDSMKADYPRSKLRGPCNVRIVVESLVNTLEPTILPKLQWFHWDGDLQTRRGQWGLIPRDCLIDGDWEKSYSRQSRTLTVLYRNPDKPDEVMGKSKFQFMSFDVHPSDFESGYFHHILMDEPPPHSIFKANRSRIMSVGGRLILSMTWPDNPAINVEWVFDEVYEKGIPGPRKAPRHFAFALNSRQNKNIDQDSLERAAANMSKMERLTRIEGQPIRFSNRIHPLFTDVVSHWCFPCGEPVFCVQSNLCPVCGSTDVVSYTHVEAFEARPTWPTVVLLDPHPRKPHMLLWVQIDPGDDWWVLAEAEVQDDPIAVRMRCDEIERQHKLTIAMRLMDPNMGASPAGIQREITWQDEFRSAGLDFDLADDSDVGRARINDRLRPDKHTRSPRLHVHEECMWTIHQFKRYCWDDKERQRPKPEHDDRPTMLKYLANADPTFKLLKGGSAPIRLCNASPGARGY